MSFRCVARVMLVAVSAIALYVVTFVVVFLYSSSPVALAWVPSAAAAIGVTIGLLGGWQGRRSRHSLADAVIALLLVAAAAGVALWLSGGFSATPSAARAPAMAADGFVATGDGEALFFHQSAPVDDGRPVLLVLHGGPGSGSVSLRSAMAPHLDPLFRTIYFDQRGVGRSSAAMSFRMEDYLDDIERLRVALQVDDWYLFGVSWGAALATEYAARHPDRVHGVVTYGGLVASQPVTVSMLRALRAHYDAAGDPDGAAWCERLEAQTSPYSRLQTVRVMNAVNRARLKTLGSPDAEIDALLAARQTAVEQWGYAADETSGSLWATAATFMQVGLEAYDARPRLRQVRTPFLLLAGEHDPLLKTAGVEADVRLLPRGAARIVPGAAHTIERPAAIAAEIAAFVDASRRP